MQLLSHIQYYPGDILIHSGDFTNTGTYQEVEDFDRWLGTLAHPYKIVVPGNHDSVMDPTIRKMASQGTLQVYKEEQTKMWKELEKPFLKNGEVLINRSVNVLGLNILGNPHTMFNGQVARTKHEKYGYAFGCSHENRMQKQLEKLSNQDYDILVTHSPPLGIADHNTKAHRGSQALREAVMRLNPALHVFGHAHAPGGNVFKLKDCEENRHKISSTGCSDTWWETLRTTFVNAASLNVIGVGNNDDRVMKDLLRHPVVLDFDKNSKQVYYRG